MSVLIAYSSTHGHTGKIARRVAEVLHADGLPAVALEILKHGKGPDPAAHEAVVVGGSLHAGKHQTDLVDWVTAHRDAIDARPNALFSVSLTAADPSDEARAEARHCVDEVIDATGWVPDHVELVAGALQYREYDVFTRVLMRLIAKHHGQSTDTSADVDLTDWDQVEHFAHHLALRVRAFVPTAG